MPLVGYMHHHADAIETYHLIADVEQAIMHHHLRPIQRNHKPKCLFGIYENSPILAIVG
jgi:hypothetical protein